MTVQAVGKKVVITTSPSSQTVIVGTPNSTTVTAPTGKQGPPGPEEIFVGPDEPTSEHIDLWFDPDAEAYYAEGPPGPPGPVSPDLRFDVRSYGVKGDGSDDKAALQAAFNSADPLVIPLDLKVSVASQVLIPAGLDLLIDGRIERMWGTGGGGGTGAMFYAAGGSADHVKISGTGSVGAVSQAIGGGQIFNGRYDDALFEEFAVDIYWGGLAYCILGDRIRMNMAKVYNSGVTVGTGGIRFLGGDDFVATACHIESGDDALQFVPGEAGGQPPTRRGVYQGCTGFSTNARFIAVAVGGTSASNVEDCSFIGCHGKASKRGIVVTIQEVATGSIKGLSIRDCSVNCTNDVQATARGGMYITNEQTSGTAVIEDVVIDNVAIKNPMSQAGYFERINRLTVINSRFESSRTPFTSDVVATNCPDLKFDNNVVYGGGTTSTLLLTGGVGGPEPACNRAIVENNKIFNIANAAYGIEARLGSDLLFRRNRLKHAAGATPTAGIRCAPAVVLPRIERNLLAELTATNLFSIANGCQAYVHENVGVPQVVPIATAYNVKAEDNRRVIELNSATGRTFTLLLETKTSLPLGEWVDFHVVGAGMLTVAGEAGVVLVGPTTATTGQALRATKTGTNTYFMKRWV